LSAARHLVDWMSRLVVVAPLKDGAYEKARSLLAGGPPFELERTEFDRHEVLLTQRELVLVFESKQSAATRRLPGEDPSLWRVAATWEKLMAESPRKAESVFTWARLESFEDVFFEATPGPGDSEGGDVFSPVIDAPGSPPSR
jgi:hypothetical protein